MKITDVKTYVVENPPPHFGGPYFVFIKLTTDNGINGWNTKKPQSSPRFSEFSVSS